MREEQKVAKVAHAREVAMFFADHDRNLGEALKLASIDLQQRSDAFAHDAHAWILYKNGKLPEAKLAITQAMAAGTATPPILFHAATIFDACGERDNAANHLKLLLSANPHFSVIYDKRVQQLREEYGL